MKLVGNVSERVSFRNILRIIGTFRVVCILENCSKRRKAFGKIPSSGVADKFTPCSNQMKHEFTFLRDCHHQDGRLCCLAGVRRVH